MNNSRCQITSTLYCNQAIPDLDRLSWLILPSCIHQTLLSGSFMRSSYLSMISRSVKLMSFGMSVSVVIYGRLSLKSTPFAPIDAHVRVGNKRNNWPRVLVEKCARSTSFSSSLHTLPERCHIIAVSIASISTPTNGHQTTVIFSQPSACFSSTIESVNSLINSRRLSVSQLPHWHRASSQSFLARSS